MVGLALERRAPRVEARVAATPAIAVSDLVRGYGDAAAVDGISFSVPRGLTLAVVGPNGAGKSTLLRVLAGLLRPHEGAVLVEGCELPAQRREVRSRVGLVGPEALLHPDLTCRENLSFAARLFGVASIRAEELLDAFGLMARADDPVRTLSTGWRRRLACARACIHRPPLLLLDEPWANLDPAAADQVDEALREHAGPTRVLVTHDIGAALANADLLLAMRAGRIAALSDRPEPSDLAGVL